MPEPSFGFSPPESFNFNFDYLNQQQPQHQPNNAAEGHPAQLSNILNPSAEPSQHYYIPESNQYPHPSAYNQGYPFQQHPYQPETPFHHSQPRLPPQPHSHPPPLHQQPPPQPLTIKLPAPNQMPVATRRSSRNRTNSLDTAPSGSEYQQSEKSFDRDDKDAEGDEDRAEDEEEKEVMYVQSSRGRRVVRHVYKESDPEDDPSAMFDDDEGVEMHTQNQRGRITRNYRIEDADDEDDDEGEAHRRYNTRHSTSRTKTMVVDDEDPQPNGRYSMRSRSKQPRRMQPTRGSARLSGRTQEKKPDIAAQRAERHARRNAAKNGALDPDGDDAYVQHTTSPESVSDDGSLEDAPNTSSEPEPEPEPEPEDDLRDNDNGVDGVEMIESDGKPYALRQRQKINYAIPPPLEEIARKETRGGRGGNGWMGNGGGKNERKHGGKKGRGLGWSASGAELGRWMGMPADDSDSDFPTRTPRKTYPAPGLFGTGAITGSAGGVGVLPAAGDLAAAAGTPSNLGKVGADSALADADPLGPNQSVSFDDVGGLDEHIHSLKEMTLLPLLYPEVFQNFGITPPRGVLFHGPPGTGKTLLARALAASCRSNGKGISFYMRKGADCLSKWVGEAERQLRLLFEEARNTQPSIIFFDEIDGLAPVRSSKQDQIHASIVSTLLALMDGMDGRGQVVVIGATNRPDAVDPALRRPGRFDREFYFGLPGLEARERILGIMTKKWKGWGGENVVGMEKEKENEKEGDSVSDNGKAEAVRNDSRSEGVSEKLKGLAKLTKGYGGADLRALCTEAALNAVQRRYPQIYKSTDRLLLAPETIEVQLRDFMISIKKLVPSSARSSTSAASPLPSQFVPLLSDSLQKVKDVVNRILPVEKKRSALEEAEYEDDGGEEGALEREMMMQAMEKLRVYRPRVVIHGPVGMGQGYIGAGALHHLEGFNIQSLELGTLMSDSTRTIEAAIVQLFVEAKRNQPSVIYIPSLVGWCAAITETARSTVRAMLDTLAPTDPILMLAVVDGPFSSLPSDVKAWFGPTRDNRIELARPTSSQRKAFFEGLVKDVKRPPNMFPDGVKRRKRVLEELPIAPPLEPRQPTATELAIQEENDQKVITLLKYRLGPILTELKRKFKRFTKRATEEYNFDPAEPINLPLETVTTTTTTVDIVQAEPNGIIEVVSEEQTVQPLVNGHAEPVPDDPFAPQQQQQIQAPPLFDMDLERMHIDLYKGKYLTPQDFLDDVGKIVHNATVRMHEDIERMYKAQAMYTATEVSMQDFDPNFRMECERMASRERRRREERRKNKGKGKAVDEGNSNGNGLATRRSARANGQRPEIAITDPVKLERRLKRQRTDGASGVDSNGSEEEAAEQRVMKRTRILNGDDNSRDPLDTLSGDVTSEAMEGVIEGPSRQPTVHFVDDGQPEGITTTPPPKPPSPPNTVPTTDSMTVESTLNRPSGFDPSLLNPISQDDNPFQTSGASQTTIPSSTQPDVSMSSSSFQNARQTPTDITMSQPHTPTDASVQPAAARPTSPAPMVVERSPTPPPPEFVIDEDALSRFAQELCDRTSSLNIEQLEQLRATCLGCVWRHRGEWDRSELLRELTSILREFVEEVEESMDNVATP